MEVADAEPRLRVLGIGHHTNRLTAPACAAAEVHDKYDRKFQALCSVDCHEVHRISRIDDGVGLVPCGQPLEMFREPRHRGIPAVLYSADHGANFFQVFARLPLPRTPRLEHVRRFIEHELEEFGRR